MQHEEETNVLEWRKDITKKIDRIDYTLHGNGSVGLKTTVDRNTRALALLSRGFWLILAVSASAIATSILK